MEEVNDTCDGCVHAHILIINEGTEEERPRIECRRYPPQMFVLRDEDDVDQVWSGFPNALERCGEYTEEAKEDAFAQYFGNIERHTSCDGTSMYVYDDLVIETTAPISTHDFHRIVVAFRESDRRNFTSADNFLNDQPVRARIRRVGEPWESEL